MINRKWLLLIALLVMAGCQKPQAQRSDRAVVIRAEFQDGGCSALSSRIKLIEDTLKSASGENVKYGFEFYIPQGMRSPDDSTWAHAVPGNIYELEGHYYYHVDYGRRVLTPRFDLTGWRLLAPYRQVDKSAESQTVEMFERFEQYWDMPAVDNPVFKAAKQYDNDC